MELNRRTTVRDLVIEMPGATRVFEKLGIDYCCGGPTPIGDACQAAGVTVEEVAESLEHARANDRVFTDAKDWRSESLASLISHIVDKHHAFTRDELDRIQPLLAKVCSVYSESRPELGEIQALFAALKGDLLLHMKKEENILFPYITEMEAAIASGEVVPAPMFGTVRNPVRMMMVEHDAAGYLLRKIRRLSDDFNAPPDACISYKTLYGALQALEEDVHQHVHLENNILFPGAEKMEAQL
jgi:regulator of cell morphogenesis and NO signaling